jgi:hypothetical protein
MVKNHSMKLVSKAQADVAQSLGNRGYEFLPNHQIQIEVSAQPAAGTLKVEYKTPGASQYVEASGSPIDLTALNKAAAFRLNGVFVQSFRFTPASFDAAKTYSVYIESNE